MSRTLYFRRNGPRFKTYQIAHEGVLANDAWFGDGEPVFGEQFTAQRAKERKTSVIELLFQTATREQLGGNSTTADSLAILADKLHYCHRGRRCGSLACPECHRAFQKAKVAAQLTAIKDLKVLRADKLLVMANVIPLRITYTPEGLSNLDIRKQNRRLKDALTKAGFKRVMLGSIDFSWEAERGIYQPHWHIAMWTSDRGELKRRLKILFPSQTRGDRPVVISNTYSLGFLPYKDKAIKLPALLRNNRRGLPYLLLTLDRTDPLELMVLFGVRPSAQEGGLIFKKIKRRK